MWAKDRTEDRGLSDPFSVNFFEKYFLERPDDLGPATLCLAIELAARAHEGRLEEAAELLGLAFHHPLWASGWLHRWPLITRLRSDLSRRLGEEAYQAAWERGGCHNLETIIRSMLSKLDNPPHVIVPHVPANACRSNR